MMHPYQPSRQCRDLCHFLGPMVLGPVHQPDPTPINQKKSVSQRRNLISCRCFKIWTHKVRWGLLKHTCMLYRVYLTLVYVQQWPCASYVYFWLYYLCLCAWFLFLVSPSLPISSLCQSFASRLLRHMSHSYAAGSNSSPTAIVGLDQVACLVFCLPPRLLVKTPVRIFKYDHIYGDIYDIVFLVDVENCLFVSSTRDGFSARTLFRLCNSSSISIADHVSPIHHVQPSTFKYIE